MKTPARLCCLLLSVWAASGCGSPNEYKAPPDPKVTVAVPLLRPVQEYFETTGQTRAVQTVELRARVGGYLKEIHFQDGQHVRAGDILFQIDQDTFAAAVASARANLARSEAQLKLAEQQLARTEHLAKENAATESALDMQNADRDSKVADVDAAKAALRSAELDLGYTTIVAPFDGVIGRHLVDLGNLIISGQTILAELESSDPIHAYFTLSEADLLRFTEMQKEGKLKPITESDPVKLDLALGDSNNFRFHGVLDYRKFGINPSTGTAERRAVFPNNPPELIPGLFVRVRAKLGDPRPSLIVDEEAIGRDQRGDYLLVVNEKNVVESRLVKLGPSENGMRAIESGIDITDRVVVQGLQRARPGSTVDPTLVLMDARLNAKAAKAQSDGKAHPGQPASGNNKEPAAGSAPAAPSGSAAQQSPTSPAADAEKK